MKTNNDEYKILRDEINQSYQSITSYNIALYTASSVIFAFALGQPGFWYCLVPLMVILPLYLLCEDERRKICWIGAYLNVFCEGKGFFWERRHHELDKKGEFTELTNTLPYIFMTAASCGGAIIKILFDDYTQNKLLVIPIFLFIKGAIAIVKKEVHFVKVRQSYINLWRQQKRIEKNRAVASARDGGGKK